jgi:hypothetical protein
LASKAAMLHPAGPPPTMITSASSAFAIGACPLRCC